MGTSHEPLGYYPGGCNAYVFKWFSISFSVTWVPIKHALRCCDLRDPNQPNPKHTHTNTRYYMVPQNRVLHESTEITGAITDDGKRFTGEGLSPHYTHISDLSCFYKQDLTELSLSDMRYRYTTLEAHFIGTQATGELVPIHNKQRRSPRQYSWKSEQMHRLG